MSNDANEDTLYYVIARAGDTVRLFGPCSYADGTEAADIVRTLAYGWEAAIVEGHSIDSVGVWARKYQAKTEGSLN